VFATIREAYGIERDDNLKLRDYPTLNHVVGFVRDRLPDAGAAAPGTAAPTAEPDAETAPLDAATAARYPRRLPTAVLRPPLERCVPSGVTLGEGTRVIVMPDTGGVAAALAKRLAKLGVEVLAIDGAPEASDLQAQLAAWTADGPVHGVYWLPALDDEGPIGALDADARREALRVRVKLLAIAMRDLTDHIGPAGTFLVSATRLGGRHGYGAAGATSILGGAVSGFTKALARERADAHVKVVDFPPSRRTAALDGRAGRGAREPRPGPGPHARDRVRRDRRGRQHRVGDHDRPRVGREGRHVPPARPRAGARPHRPGPRAPRQRPR
jgi:hypothetical protein